MKGQAFNHLLDNYKRQVLAKLEDAPELNTTPAWLLLKRHVQEWQHHYQQESQAIGQLDYFYGHIRQEAASMSLSEQQRLWADEERDYQQIVFSFQKKRNHIWLRQQQELDAINVYPTDRR